MDAKESFRSISIANTSSSASSLIVGKTLALSRRLPHILSRLLLSWHFAGLKLVEVLEQFRILNSAARVTFSMTSVIFCLFIFSPVAELRSISVRFDFTSFFENSQQFYFFFLTTLERGCVNPTDKRCSSAALCQAKRRGVIHSLGNFPTRPIRQSQILHLYPVLYGLVDYKCGSLQDRSSDKDRGERERFAVGKTAEEGRHWQELS